MTDEPGLRALLERFIDFSDGSARYITDRRIPQAMPASCRSAALKLRARLSTPAASDGSLDVAWAAAEAALPEGWRVGEVKHTGYRDGNEHWLVMAWQFEPHEKYDTFEASYGPSPIAALRELAARLSESPSEGQTE